MTNIIESRFGGEPIVAARFLAVGDQVTVGAVRGYVVQVTPARVIVEDEDGDNHRIAATTLVLVLRRGF